MSRAVLFQVSALSRRDAIIEFGYTFQLILRFVNVAMAVVMFFFLGRLVGQPDQLAGYRGGYFEFALVGLVVMGYSQACVSSFAQSIQRAQHSGTLEILLATEARLPTLLTGTLVVPLLLASLDAAVFLIVGAVLGALSLEIGRLVLATALLTLTLGTFAAVGIFSAALIVLTKRGDPLSALVLQASHLLAGAVFPVSVLPGVLQVLSAFVPAFYGLRGVRTLLLSNGGLAEVSTDLAILCAFNVVLLPAATWALSRALRIARVTGTLGNR